MLNDIPICDMLLGDELEGFYVLSQSEPRTSKTNKPYDATVLFKDREDKNGNQRVGFELQFDNKPKGRS